jgi:hypothetical protein
MHGRAPLEFWHRISSNVRVLEGALIAFYALASLPAHCHRNGTDCLSDILRASDRSHD